MIEPLKDKLVKLLLDGIQQDRLGNGQQNNNDVIRGVIQSFVSVQEYKKKGNLEVLQHFKLYFWNPTSYSLTLHNGQPCCLK